MKFRVRRLASDAVDLILCAIGALLVSVLPAYFASGFRLGKSAMLILGVVMTFIFFLFRDFTDRSIGKKLFKLKIVTWDGKAARPFQKLRRNFALLLFPVEILMILAGYDTLGDSLALTCVTEYKSSEAPGMKKGNNTMRKVTLILLFSVIGIIVIVFAVNSLRIVGSDGYHALSEYMQGPQIEKEFGKEPVWKVEGLKKEDDGKLVYTVTVNGKTFDVSAVMIGEEWFIYGVQSETVEKLSQMISKIATDNTERFALADMDRDGEPELLEYFVKDLRAYINVYLLDSVNPALTLDTNSYAGNPRGSWNVYQLESEDKKTKSYYLIGIYASYSSNYSEKKVCMVTKKKNVLESSIVFSESVTTTASVNENDENVMVNEGSYLYNDIVMTPGDYFSNYNSFFVNYTPCGQDGLAFERWERDNDLDKDALMMAIALMKTDWEKN